MYLAKIVRVGLCRAIISASYNNYDSVPRRVSEVWSAKSLHTKH